MLHTLTVKNFTVFESAEFAFSSGLNVVIGENGTGKSQLLKLGYALAATSYAQSSAPRQGKEEMQRAVADKLVATFRPEGLGRLVSRQQGRNRCEVAVHFFAPENAGYSFSFATNSRSEVKLEQAPVAYLDAASVFFPTREMLSVFPGFAAAYRARELEFDETYYDLALALDARPLKGKRPDNVAQLIGNLETVMNGSVEVQNGRFYLLPKNEGRGRIEMPLVAEGIRKLAMLTYLLINGVLRNRSTLFWDEPETNLHPQLIQHVAKTLVLLASAGLQVVIATHSLFLLRELQIQLQLLPPKKALPRYFTLSEAGGTTIVSTGSTIEELEPLAMLDADLAQTERYLALP